jgi:hypothetical protein
MKQLRYNLWFYSWVRLDEKNLSEESRHPCQYLNPELPQCVSAGMYKFPGAGSPGRLHFVQQGLLLLLGHQCGTCFVSTFWRQEIFELAPTLFGKFEHHYCNVQYIASFFCVIVRPLKRNNVKNGNEYIHFSTINTRYRCMSNLHITIAWSRGTRWRRW